LLQSHVEAHLINALHLVNCTTGHITFDKNNFIAGTYVEYKDTKSVEGVGGTTSAAGRGLVRWTLTYQDNHVHLLILHNMNHVPTSPLRLLSPQQLSFDIGDNQEKGAYVTTFASGLVFVWHHQQYCKPIAHRWTCNIPILHAGPVWDKALVKHVHESLRDPPESQPTAYCCFIAPTATHIAQEAGIESFYDGSISSTELPKHGNT
jgi:hypothetical protein